MTPTDDTFQTRAGAWTLDCFGPDLSGDRTERNRRFLEEALELAQSLGGTREQAHALVDYVFSRAPGQPAQELGGTMVTLAALCHANGLDMRAEAEAELARIARPEVMARIRDKQAGKPKL